MGIVGVLMACTLLFKSILKGTLLILRRGVNGRQVLGMGMSLMFIVRSFVDVDALCTYGIGALLLYSIVPMLGDNHKGASKSPGSLVGKPVGLSRAGPLTYMADVLGFMQASHENGYAPVKLLVRRLQPGAAQV